MAGRGNTQIEPADSFYGGQSMEAGTPNYEYISGIDNMKNQLNSYLIEYLHERLNTKGEKTRKDDFLREFGKFDCVLQKEYMNYISGIIKNDPSLIEDFDDDTKQLNKLMDSMSSLNKLEAYACVSNAYRENKQMSQEPRIAPGTIVQPYPSQIPQGQSQYPLGNFGIYERNDLAYTSVSILGGNLYGNYKYSSDYNKELQTKGSFDVQLGTSKDIELNFKNRNVTIRVTYNINGISFQSIGGFFKGEFGRLVRTQRGNAILFGNYVPDGRNGEYMLLKINIGPASIIPRY